MSNVITINEKIKVGGNEPLLLIAGPCQIQSYEHCLMIANHLKNVTKNLPINLVFKASYDKANRTSISSKRGIGIDEGLQVLADIKKETGLPVITDIHSVDQADKVAAIVDILQIPAFLCRQTDLLVAAAKTGKTVMIKKGQFVAPEDMQHSAGKVIASGNKNVMLCERGACFGYHDLVVDPRSLYIMREELGHTVVFDATHSVQRMGGGAHSGGNRKFIKPLAKMAAGVGIDGLFIECHEKPEDSPSDSECILPLNDVKELVETVCSIRASTQK